MAEIKFNTEILLIILNIKIINFTLKIKQVYHVLNNFNSYMLLWTIIKI